LKLVFGWGNYSIESRITAPSKKGADMSDTLTSEQIAEIAEQAAERAVEKFALLLGVDVTDKTQTARVRSNLEYIDRRRENEQDMRRLVKNSAAAIMTTALIGAATWALVVFKGGFHDWLITFTSK
jgi:hypothetical protein